MNDKKIRLEEILKDCVPFLPIIFLVLGYFIAAIRIGSLPYDEVSVEVEEPIYEMQKIGQIPLEHLQNEKSSGWRTIYSDVPILDKEGKPIKRKSIKTFRGRGTHEIKLEEHEITIPKMASTPWRKTTKTDFEIEPSPTGGTRLRPVAVWVTYKENVENIGTGVYYKTKKVTFDIGVDPKSGAIYGATLGTALTFVLFFIKYAKKLRTKRTNNG